MSGNSKRILYTIVSTALWFASIAGVVLLVLFTVPRPIGTADQIVVNALIVAILLRIPAVVHEFGHLLFGWIAGMKFVGVTLSYFRIGWGKFRIVNPNYAGSTEMFPKKRGHVRAKTILFTIGGSVLCLALGGAFLGLYLGLPYHACLLFCGMLGIMLLYEGLIALFPVELPAGKTDGAVLLGLCRHAPEEEVMLRVLAAQAVLSRGNYRDIERELLFSAPIVREDLPAYHALLLLQVNYLKEMGEEDAASEKLERLRSLSLYLTDEEREELKKFEP